MSKPLFKNLGEQELRNRQWSMEDFHNFFKEEGGIMNSSRFRAVEKAFKACEQMQNQPINEQNAMKMVKANQELMKACKAYAEGKTSGGERRLAVFEKLVQFQEAKNLDQIRDLRTVRDYQKQGKSFRDVASFEIPHITLEGTGEKVGANVSERLKVEVNGKKGFFTAENQLHKASDYYLDLLQETKDTNLKQIYGKNFSVFEAMTATETSMPKSSVNIDLSAQIRGRLQEVIVSLDVNDPKRLKMEEQLKNQKRSSVSLVGRVYEELKKSGNMNPSPEVRKEALRKEFEKEADKEALLANLDLYASIPAPQEDMRLGEYQNLIAKYHMTDQIMKLDQKARGLDEKKPEEKKQLESIRREKGNIEELYHNDRAVYDMAKAAIKATAALTAANVAHSELDQTELTARNVAMSRMAELLGMGEVIAHSEKMVVKSGAKEITGCFMEFAQGSDVASTDYDTMRKFSQVEISYNAGLNRDMANIEILDCLCNQADRHGMNMFYKLSEPDERGKRNIIGLQGIDNDLAFGDSKRIIAKQGDLKELIFIDREVADRVRKLDGDAIDFALGDLIPEAQRNLVKERLTAFQNHMKKNMVEIDKDGWELDEYSKDMSKEEIQALDARGKAYVKGVKDLDFALKSEVAAFARHKTSHFKSGIETSNKEFKRQEDAMNLAGDQMQSLYGEEHKTGLKAAEAKREPISLKEIQARNKAAQSANIRTKLPFEKEEKKQKDLVKTEPKKAENPQRVQTNFVGIGGARPERRTSIRLAQQREASAERQKEAGDR